MRQMERTRPRHDFNGILDRILDRGIVVDAWSRITMTGIDLSEMKVVVTDINPGLEPLSPALEAVELRLRVMEAKSRRKRARRYSIN